MRLYILFLCFSFVACHISEVKNSGKSLAPTVGTTKLNPTEDTRSKTEKRESSAQTTAAASESPKDEPFRPIYRPYYYPNVAFRPTAASYETAAASPQAYYEKPETAQPEASLQERDAHYRGQYNEDAYAQLEQPRSQVTPTAATYAQQSAVGQQHYIAPEANLVYERVPVPVPVPHMHYNHQHAALLPQHQRLTAAPLSTASGHPQNPQQQQQQYIIAIPLSYARHLQQQLARIPTHASQAYALPTAMHSLPYRPFQYSLPQSPVVHLQASDGGVAGGQRFIPLPATMLIAAAQAAAYTQKPPGYQPVYYHHAQPIYQSPSPQDAVHGAQPLYAYQGATSGKQHLLPQVVRVGAPTKSGLKATYNPILYTHPHSQVPATSAAASSAANVDQQQQQSISPGYANTLPLIRVSAPRALLAPTPYLHQSLAVMRPYHPAIQYSVAGHYPESGIVPPSLPYLSQPGAVHYGTHLYHSAGGPSLATHATKSDLQNPVTNIKAEQQQQQQENQHQHQQQQESLSQPQHQQEHHHLPHQQQQQIQHSHQATSSASVVKYP